MDFRDIFLFQNIDDKLLEKIKSISTVRKIKKNEIVFYEKDLPKYLHILVEGNAKVYKVDKNGNELIIHKFQAISLIGEMANLEEIPYPANCSMDSNGLILKIEWNKFKELLYNSNICFEIMKSLLKKLRYLDNLIHTNLILDTNTKIAKFIYEYPDLFENLKQHNIASLLNIKPETLSRKLKFFKEEGIIENQGSKLKIKDKEKIKELFSW